MQIPFTDWVQEAQIGYHDRKETLYDQLYYMQLNFLEKEDKAKKYTFDELRDEEVVRLLMGC
jgi:hypothetical protein